MSSDSIRGYTYDTETLCPSCTQESVGVANPDFRGSVEEFLDAAAKILGINRWDENTFDSSTFPKVIFDHQVEDSNEQCEHCGEKLIG